MAVTPTERKKIWVLAGGRCCLCKQYLMEGNLTHHEMPLGEGAHIVGQLATKGSPRGNDPLPVSQRDTASNIMLACGSCHDEIDNQVALGTLDVAKLLDLKREHERLIKHLTGMAADRRTLVLRMLGKVRGDSVELHKDTASATVIHAANRFPDFALAFDRHGVEIDLRNLPGEIEGTVDYYKAGMSTIDESIALLRGGIAKDKVNHLSVFAFARLPLLIYLGSKLDDTVPTEIYQRTRTPESWEWATAGSVAEFEFTDPQSFPQSEEIVVVANISGTIQRSELPPQVAGLPHLIVQLKTGVAGPDTLRRRESYDNFLEVIRHIFSHLEAYSKDTKKIHLFAALPISAGIGLGRAHVGHVHPALVIYDRTGEGYEAVMEIR